MNIRSPNDIQGYPPRDKIPANILTRHCDELEYNTQCYTFFAAIFKVLRTSLENNKSHSGWYKAMCTLESRARRSFFEDLDLECATVSTVNV